ncbi:hypothetical protein CR513_46037, partial [Mucuna pruriens]
MMNMFIDTLPNPLYDKAVGSVASNFVDLVMVGERIESRIKRGKFSPASSGIGFAKKPSQEKKRGEANAILLESTAPYDQGKPPTARINPSPPLQAPYLLKALGPTEDRYGNCSRVKQHSTHAIEC